MTAFTMTPEQLADALDRHGSDLSRWPPVQSDAARALLARSAEAGRLYRQAVALDQLIRAHDPAAALAPGQVARISRTVLTRLAQDDLRRASPGRRLRRWLDRWGGVPRYAGGLALGLAVGLAVGLHGWTATADAATGTTPIDIYASAHPLSLLGS